MTFAEQVAEGRRLIEECGASKVTKLGYVRGWERWEEFCAASGVDPLDASWKDVVGCLDAEEMAKAGVTELRGVIRLVYRARGMAAPSDDRRVAARAGKRVHVDVESYPEETRRLLELSQRWYVAWCQQRGGDPLYGGGEQVAEFLRGAVGSLGISCVRYAHIGISFYLEGMGLPATEHHPAVLAACREIRAEWKPVALGGVPSKKNVKSESYWRQWNAWLDERGIRCDEATTADVLDWLRGFEAQTSAGERVSSLSRRYDGGDNPFLGDDVVRWVREHRRRVRSGEIVKPVTVSRKEESKAEWAAARARRAVEELDVPAGLTREEVVRVRARGGRRLAGTTVDGYAANWALFRDWLQERDVTVEDVSDIHVQVYLEERGHLSVRGLYQARDSLSHGFKEYGFMVNPAGTDLVSDYLRNVSLARKEAPSQVDPVREQEFRLIKDWAVSAERGPIRLRTKLRLALVLALVRLMYDGLLRSGEAERAKWKDLSRSSDGSGALLVPSSKTDLFGRGEYTYVSVTAWKYLDMMGDLRALCGVPEPDGGFIFGISSHRMYQLIVAACAEAGLGGWYGTRSMRIGAAQDLARGGFSLSMIMQAGRWKTPDKPRYYIRHIQVAEGAMAEMQRMLLSGRLKVEGEARGYDIMAAFHAAQWGR